MTHLLSLSRAHGRIFVDSYARSYSLWYPYSWIPSSPWAGVQPGYEGDFRSECLAEGDSDDGTGPSLSADMLRVSCCTEGGKVLTTKGNIRLPLAGDGRPDLAKLSPENPLWPVYIARLYHVSAHPTALMLLIDCSRYDELSNCAPYTDAISGEVDIMRNISYESVPNMDILRTIDVV